MEVTPFILSGTEDTPSIILDKQNKQFKISGRSLPEDVTVFYQPVLDWVDSYSKSPSDEMVLEIQLEYFNTASSKIILDILMKLENIHENGNKVKIKWYFDINDEDMSEAGEEYSELVSVPFEKIQY